MTRADRRSGFVMVSVLAVLAVLAALVAALVLIARANVAAGLSARNDLSERSLIQAAKEAAAYELLLAGLRVSDVDGQEIRLDAGSVRLAVTNPAGRIDLNASDPALIANAYAASGAKGMKPGAFAARVIDWRDGDDTPGPDGAEATAYRQGRLPWAPPNHAFLSVDEIGHIAGVSADDAARLKPYFTVDNPAGVIDVLAAPERVLAVIPGLDSRSARLIVTLRTPLDDDRQARIEQLVQPCGKLAAAGRPAIIVELELTIRRPGLADRVVRTAIASDPDGKRPFRTISESE